MMASRSVASSVPFAGGVASRRWKSDARTLSTPPGLRMIGALDGVLQLAHVPRPVVAAEVAMASAGMVSMRLFRRRAKLLHEVAHEVAGCPRGRSRSGGSAIGKTFRR